ncbi:glycosyltransferase family 4 protein [Anabaenopsis tanganyikae CS-531]|uniref:Glycosyltransferase family 1 protein n=2 Tax=Anabaenopsis TaxID=110103 RepID=A0ABT5AXH0_9CYAN|nr:MULTISPECIES: glycosyltransferase family 1 protein [Anabaenopsis]MDB9541101.1 glycosyltransferase family 1 protein [Anabaenopsis arnoldii]MDH6093540.1 glycosyltransferase family 4 protein [Anabaenopsis arnoldii]MDH6106167.1 glycosyltransferase family 4 protein [Anabaenopsis tanganyikae CS-531]
MTDKLTEISAGFLPSLNDNQTGIEVALITTCSTESVGSMLIYVEMVTETLSSYSQKVRLTRIDLLNLVPDLFFLPAKLKKRFQQLWLLLISPLQLRKYMRKYNGDIFHLMDGSSCYVLRGIPPEKCVVTLHDLIPVLQQKGEFPIPPPGFFARWLIRENLKSLKSQKNICVDSTCTGQDFQQNVSNLVPTVIFPGIRSSLLDLIPAEIPGWQERVRDGKRIILHIGNNGFYKNRATVIRVFAELVKSHPLSLVMAGSPPDMELQMIIQELQVGDKITFVSHPNDGAVSSLYLKASILLFPSYYEGFGWPPLEAMAFGCPVVCSNSGSLPEIVGNAALMASPDDLSAIVAQCDFLLNQSEEATKLVQAGLENIQRFSSLKMGEDLINFYNRVQPCGGAGE